MRADFSAQAGTADEINPLDALRNTIEQDSRFKTAFHGYDKRAVQDYISRLSAVFDQALEAVKNENQRLLAENGELKLQVTEQETLIAQARADERHKLEGAISIKESMLDGLRTSNQRLTDENRQLKLSVTDLNARLCEVRDQYADNCSSVSVLNDQLKGLLAAKIAECSGIITNWQSESVRLLGKTALSKDA